MEKNKPESRKVANTMVEYLICKGIVMTTIIIPVIKESILQNRNTVLFVFSFTSIQALIVRQDLGHIMVAYFCHHLSDNYVDLSDIYVDLSDLYVDLSLIPSVEK